MLQIAQWLQNGTYAEGVKLYNQHGTNAFLKQKFAATFDDYNIKKLRSELLLLVSGFELPVASALLVAGCELPVASEKVLTPNPQPETHNHPSDHKKYLQILKQKERLYIELNILMEQKHHLPAGDELRKCALSILSKHQLLTECWAKLDHYQEHGCFVCDEPPPAPIIEPKKEKQLLRQTISKAKARLKSGSCRDTEQTEALLKKSQVRLAELVKKPAP